MKPKVTSSKDLVQHKIAAAPKSRRRKSTRRPRGDQQEFQPTTSVTPAGSSPVAPFTSQAHRDWQLLSEIASALPLPDPDCERELEEHLSRCKRIGIRIARRLGVEDPDAVFFEAYSSILKSPKPGPEKWPFLPKRIKDRAISAYRRQMRRTSGVPTVPIDESRALAIESPMVGPELPWLAEAWRPVLEPLTDQERQFFVLFYFLEWPIARIASVRTLGSTQSAVKTRLFRIREKLQRISYRPQPSAD